MDKFYEWLSANVKEGVNIEEGKELLKDNTIAGITTKEQAIDFMNKQPAFKSGIDSLISKAVESNSARYKEEKLPGIIAEAKAQWVAENNPEETPEQKQIRELQEQLNAEKKQRAINEAQSTLRAKAKELGFDPELAAGLHVYGDTAEDVLSKFAEYHSTALQSTEKKVRQDTLSGKAPKASLPAGTKTVGMQEWETMSHPERSAFQKSGGKIVDD